MNLYVKTDPQDLDWVARAALFHGHLGPWLIAGAMVGQDAVRRLKTPGQWKIDVTCWMPADRQRTPFSCILDGLQASSGATLGKQNIRFNQSDDVLNGGWPVIHVVRLKDADRPTEGIAYRATGRFHELLKAVSPEHLEDGSRALAHEEVGSLFEIRPMSPLELMQAHRS